MTLEHRAALPLLLLFLSSFVQGQATAPVPTKATRIEGTIVERSALPDPKKSSYPNAFFTAELAVEGVDGDTPIPPHIAAVFPGFSNRVLQTESTFQVGDRLSLAILPFQEMDKATRSTQQADTLTRFDLDLYYALSSETIDTFQPGLTPPSATSTKQPTDVAPNPMAPTPEERQARAAAIRSDLERIDAIVRAHDRDWEAWYDSLDPYRAQLRDKLTENDGFIMKWPYSFSDLDWMTYHFDPSDPVHANMIDAIDRLNQGLRRFGIDLIIAFLPERDSISAPRFLDDLPADGVLQPSRIRILHELLSRDVEILDMTQAFRELEDEQPIYYYFSKDHHPSDPATRVAAAMIQDRLDRYALPGPTQTFATHPKTYPGPRPDPRYSTERPSLVGSTVLTSDLEPFGYPKDAPVLFIGDSFLVSPNDYGMNYGDVARHVALLSGRVPSVFIRKSGTPAMAQYLARLPRSFFQNRKVVVFYAAFHNLTGPYVEYWRNVDLHQRYRNLAALTAQYEVATPVRTFADIDARRQIRIEPPDDRDSHTGSSINFFQGTTPREIILPPIPVEPGRDYYVYLHTKVWAYDEWRIFTNGGSPTPINLLKGYNWSIVPVRPIVSPLRLTCVVPAGTAGAQIHTIEIRRAD